MRESVALTAVGTLPGALLGICIMRMSHFDDARTSHALGRLTVHDVFDDIANVSSWMLGSKESFTDYRSPTRVLCKPPAREFVLKAGLASLTVRIRPLMTEPLISAIAWSAACSSITINPKPLERPVSRSVMI